MTRTSKTPEEFDDLRVPPGNIGGNLLQDRDRSLAAAVVDRLGDIKPLSARVEAIDQIDVEKRADIGNQPVVARFDRLVIPHPIDATAQDCRLGADAVDDLAQWPLRVELI